MVCLVTLSNATMLQESWECVLFQPVLKAYPTNHSWIITAHCIFRKSGETVENVKQMGRTQQLLHSLQQKPLAPIYMILALQAELTNLDSIYTSYKPLILTATQLLKRNLPSTEYHLFINVPGEVFYPSWEMH